MSSTGSFPTLGTWIEIQICGYLHKLIQSFPTLGTWIEIRVERAIRHAFAVVPYIGNVD